MKFYIAWSLLSPFPSFITFFSFIFYESCAPPPRWPGRDLQFPYRKLFRWFNTLRFIIVPFWSVRVHWKTAVKYEKCRTLEFLFKSQSLHGKSGMIWKLTGWKLVSHTHGQAHMPINMINITSITWRSM